MKQYILFFLFTIFFISSFATEVQLKSKSLCNCDSLWKTYPIRTFNATRYYYLDGLIFPSEQEKKELSEETQKMYLSEEKFMVDLRLWGIDFWRLCPNDDRRFKWLLETIRYKPHFFLNTEQGVNALINKNFQIQIDTFAYQLWDKQYLSYKKEFFNSFNGNDSAKYELIYSELLAEISNALWPQLRESIKFDYKEWTKKSIKYLQWWYSNTYTKDPKKYTHGEGDGLDDMQITFISGPIRNLSHALNWSEEDQERYLKLFLESGVERLVSHAAEKLTLLRLTKEPITFQYTSTNGQKLNSSNYRGKIVLLDFWNTNCLACIRLMPSIKQAYDKYRDKGFEVISICADGNKDQMKAKEKAEQIHHKIGANWPMVFVKQQQCDQYKEYGFIGAPQLLLLNKEGKLIKYNNELLTPGKLDELVKWELGIK